MLSSINYDFVNTVWYKAFFDASKSRLLDEEYKAMTDELNIIVQKSIDDNSDIVLTATETTRSPWFNMVSIDKKGNTKLLIDSSESYSRRQDVPKAYSLTTVAYVSRPEFIINSDHIFDGRVKSVMIPEERSIDIDTELDFKIANFLKRT